MQDTVHPILRPRRKARLWVAIAVLAAAAAAAAGCAGSRTPPRLQAEVRPPRPQPQARWVPGHWEWAGRKEGYRWVEGRWVAP